MFGHDAGKLLELLERAVGALEAITEPRSYNGGTGYPLVERMVWALEEISTHTKPTELEPVLSTGGVVGAEEHRVVYESGNGLEAVCACGHLMNIQSFAPNFNTIAGAFAQHLNDEHEEAMQ